MSQLHIKHFLHEETNTYTYVVADMATKKAAIIDSVLDYDQNSGRTTTPHIDGVITYTRSKGFVVEWILETHAHADHLTAAPYVQKHLGGNIAIGAEIKKVQQTFGEIFNIEAPYRSISGKPFDHLFEDGESFNIGNLEVKAIHTPGHTPACLVYVVEDAAFVGDTLFMPDSGTARCDFPGGSAKTLYNSIQKLFNTLPDSTRLFMCHDYGADGTRPLKNQTTIAEEKQHNIHIKMGTDEATYTTMRTTRDAALKLPKLIIPSIQVNIRAGHFPAPEGNGTTYLKVPLGKF